MGWWWICKWVDNEYANGLMINMHIGLLGIWSVLSHHAFNALDQVLLLLTDFVYIMLLIVSKKISSIWYLSLKK